MGESRILSLSEEVYRPEEVDEMLIQNEMDLSESLRDRLIECTYSLPAAITILLSIARKVL